MVRHPAPNNPYVFVSYASTDRERVLPVVAALEHAGVSVWLDQQGIAGGENYGTVIADAIKGAAAFILMASASSLASRNVKQEIALGWRFERAYLPLLLEAGTIPNELAYWLEAAQWIEVLDKPEAAWLPQVLAALHTLGIAPVPPQPEETRLAGRERELARLRDKLADVREGKGGLVLIGGEAGIGKTTLAEVACAAAARRGAVVLTGRCFDLAETPAYGPWLYLFDRYRPDSVLPPPPAAFATRGIIGEVGSQSALFLQVRDFLEALAARRPVVVLLDDLHWGDPASLDLARYLAQSIADLSVLMLITYRTDELTRRHPLYQLLPLLVREADAERLDLRRLDDAGVRAIVAERYALAEADSDRLVPYLQGRAEGNAFFLGELLRALEETGTLRREGERWALDELARAAVPPLLRQVIDGRLARLDEESQRLLAVAAIIGHEVPLDLWATVGEVNEDALLDVVERGVEARLLVEMPDGERVQFAHALIRETLYEGMMTTRRRRLHRAIAEALIATTDPEPDAVAYHLQRTGDPRAAEWLIAAGERAERSGAWMTAAERFETALPLLEVRGAGAAERGWLLYRIAILRRLADPPRSVAALEEVGRLAAEGEDAALAAYALVMRGHLRCFAGDLARGIQELEGGIAAVGALPVAERDRREVATYVERTTGTGTLVLWLAYAGRLAEARAIGEGYVAGTAVRDARGIVRAPYVDAFWGLGDLYARRGEPEKAQATFDEARAGYDALGYASMAYTVLLHILHNVIVPYRTEVLAERRRLTDDAERGAERARAMRGALPGGIERLPFMAVDAIGWGEARNLAGWVAGLPAAQEWAAAVVGAVLLAQGDTATLRPLIAQLLPDGPGTRPGDVYFQSAVALQRAAVTLALREGTLPSARAWLAAHDRWMVWSEVVQGRSEGQALWAQYHRQSGDMGQARAHAERALAHATEPRQPLALITAHRLMGEVDTDAGQFADAEMILATALTLADACEAPYERALTLLAMAELRAVQGEHEVAWTLLDEVRAVCEPLGAQPALARADALAARLAV